VKKTVNEQRLWHEDPHHPDWGSMEVSCKILAEEEEYRQVAIPLEWAKTCVFRIRTCLRKWMREYWVGLEDERLGFLTDWIIACAIARENCLLLGIPGVAKSEIATQMFKWLGLKPAGVENDKLQQLGQADIFDWSWWSKRQDVERHEQKYFHYLLSRFSQVEELFGPIELELLKKGIMTRVNFGLLTGPGVRAAFLDEVFKASSSVLNTLLTLTQERTYFNWGGMVPSDLVMFIAASNEMPGGFATGMAGQGSGGEDFQTLHAFLDRFPVRIEIPNASGTSQPGPNKENTNLAEAFNKAMEREEERFTAGRPFPEPQERKEDRPCINDILLLGRCCLQGLSKGGEPLLFSPQALDNFKRWFVEIACELQLASRSSGTFAVRDTITWTVTPRKLRSIYKVALALALVRDDRFVEGTRYVQGPGVDSLRVFDMIWDSPVSRSQLYRDNEERLNRAKKGLRS
jgi:hypothetical protein